MQDFIPHSARSPEEPALPSGSNSVPSDSLIKRERHSPSDLRCSSPPTPSSHPIPSFTRIPLFSSGRAPTLNTRKKRSSNPYAHPPPRVSSGRRQESSAMSALQYGNWPPNTVKYEESDYPPGDLSRTHRGSSDGDQQPPYYFAPVSFLRASEAVQCLQGVDAHRFARIILCVVITQISARTLPDQ